MVTALSIAGDLSFNPETDSLKGSSGKNCSKYLPHKVIQNISISDIL